MDTNAKQIGRCLPADVLDRIEVIKAQARAIEAQRLGSGAGQRETTRAVPERREEENRPGKVVQMPKRNGRAKPRSGAPSAIVLPLRLGIDCAHG